MDMKKTIIVSAIAATGLTSAAAAQAQGFYVYGEAAHSDISSSEAEGDIRQQDVDGQALTNEINSDLADFGMTADLEYSSSSSDDDTDTSLGVGLGYVPEFKH